MLDSQSLFFHCQNLYKYCTLALKAFKKFNLILKTRIRLSLGHSTHFQVGGENPKVEGEIMLNQYAKQSCILLSL